MAVLTRPRIQFLVTVWDLPWRPGPRASASPVHAYPFDTEAEARTCYEAACERVRAGTAEACAWSHEGQNLGVFTAWEESDR